MSQGYEKQLDQIFEENDEVYAVKQLESWSITDLKSALWADGVIHEREMKIKEIEEAYEERKSELVRKLDEWLSNSTKRYKDDIDFFKNHLHVWHMRIIDDEKLRGAKKISKTIPLTYKKLTQKAQQPEILYKGKKITEAKDDPEFVQFVECNSPQNIKKEVKWGDFKKTLKQKNLDGKDVYVDENGEVVPNIELIPQPEKYDWADV